MLQRNEVQKQFVSEEPGDVFKVRMTDVGGFQRRLVVQGSPYLSKEFKDAKWIAKGQFEKKVKMRYDAYRDNIQLIQNGKQSLLVKAKDVEAEIDGKLYQYIDYLDHDNLKSGYFTPLNEGKTLLFSRTAMIIIPPRMPENGYEFVQPAKFEAKTIHYIKRSGKTATPLQDLSRKEVLAVLWDKYSELRTYARKNKLRLRTEAEVIRVLEYYDSLKTEENQEELQESVD